MKYAATSKDAMEHTDNTTNRSATTNAAAKPMPLTQEQLRAYANAIRTLPGHAARAATISTSILQSNLPHGP